MSRLLRLTAVIVALGMAVACSESSGWLTEPSPHRIGGGGGPELIECAECGHSNLSTFLVCEQCGAQIHVG